MTHFIQSVQTSGRILSGASMLAFLALPLGAQTAVQPPMLGTITLLGTGLETTVFENPSSVTVIDEDEIARIPPARTADFLRTVPGLRVEEQGITRISIRGEDARRVRILIDGQAVTDHTTYGPPVVVDPAMVERIEVVRGASSVVSGQRAIGGTINIITRRGADAPLEGSSTGSYFSATRGWRVSNTLAGRQGGFTWRVMQGRSVHDNQRAAGIGELPNSDWRDSNLSAWLGYEWGNHSIGLQATAFDLAANVYTGDPDFTIEMPARNLRKLGFFYEGTDLADWLPRLTFDAFSQTIDRQFRNDVRPAPMVRIVTENEDQQRTWGLNATGELRFTDAWRGVLGLQYEDDFLDVNALTQAYPPFGPTPPPTIRLDQARIRTASAYFQNEVTLAPGLTGTAGLRFYHVRAALEASNTNPLSSNSDSRVLGSLGLTWELAAPWMLRATASQGYNYPTLNQLFTATTAGGQLTLPNPDLRPESTDNFEIGARYDNGRTVIDATLFHARARDYILRQIIPGGGTTPTGQYQNIAGARTSGIELYAEHELSGGWVPFASLAYMRRVLDYGNGFTTADSGTPALSGIFGIRRDFDLGTRPASFEVFGTGESGVTLRNDSGVVTAQTSGFTTFGMRASVDLSRHARVNLAVNNLFNRQYHGYGQLPGAERSFDLVLQARF